MSLLRWVALRCVVVDVADARRIRRFTALRSSRERLGGERGELRLIWLQPVGRVRHGRTPARSFCCAFGALSLSLRG